MPGSVSILIDNKKKSFKGQKLANRACGKGQPPSADLRYGEEDNISPCTFIFAAIMG